MDLEKPLYINTISTLDTQQHGTAAIWWLLYAPCTIHAVSFSCLWAKVNMIFHILNVFLFVYNSMFQSADMVLICHHKTTTK